MMSTNNSVPFLRISMNFKSSWNISATSLFTKCWHSVNSWLYICCSISDISFSFTSFLTWKECLPTSFVSAWFTAIWLHDTLLLLVLFTGPTTHQPSPVLNAQGPPFQVWRISIGSSAFVQLAPMSNPTEISSLKVSWFMTFSKYFHFLSWYGFVILSLSTGRSALMNVIGWGNHSFLSSLILATLRPSNAVELLVNSPFNVLIVSEVFLPDTPR